MHRNRQALDRPNGAQDGNGREGQGEAGEGHGGLQEKGLTRAAGGGSKGCTLIEITAFVFA